MTFRKTAWQNAKEQWILAAMTVAISGAVWGFVREEGKGWTIATVLGVAGPRVALTGNVVAAWFRIRKGQKTDRTLSTIETKVQRMLSDFDARMTDLVGKVTGGQSSPYLKVQPVGANPLRSALVTILGDHTLRELTMRVEIISPFSADLGSFRIGTILYGHVHQLREPHLDQIGQP